MTKYEARLLTIVAVLLTVIMLAIVGCNMFAEHEQTQRKYIAGTNVLDHPIKFQ